MPTPTEEKQKRQIAFLADRMAVMLCILKSRHGDWSWLYGENTWESEEGMAAEMRDWPEYATAKDILRLWLRKHNAREAQDAKAKAMD